MVQSAMLMPERDGRTNTVTRTATGCPCVRCLKTACITRWDFVFVCAYARRRVAPHMLWFPNFIPTGYWKTLLNVNVVSRLTSQDHEIDL